jgi:hypothetical protein
MSMSGDLVFLGADSIPSGRILSVCGRIAISTLGTRGNVQPYIALALGLTEKGHDVQLAVPIQFEAMVRDCGIAFASRPGARSSATNLFPLTFWPTPIRDGRSDHASAGINDRCRVRLTAAGFKTNTKPRPRHWCCTQHLFRSFASAATAESRLAGGIVRKDDTWR